ncbi:hypothetical protein BDV18DRAFT_143862 [Aspergillus unguis]
MAPVKFTRPPDLSGRTPIYRLSKNPEPIPASQPQHPPPPAHANNPPQPHPPYPPYPPHNAPYNPPHSQPPPLQTQTPNQSQTQTPTQPPQSIQSTPQENKENAYVQSPQTPNPVAGAQNSPLTKRRGRKLQEHETLILVNCCLEYQSLYHDNPSRFWYCVATSLKRQIKRNFSWQSCRQIVEELVGERRERRRDVAAGKVKEQPLTELVLATDKWISFSDAPPQPNIATDTSANANSLKRPVQEPPATDSNAVKRPRPQESAPPMPPPSQSLPPYQVPTVPGGPTMAEFQTLKMDLRGLRMDVQGMRREILEVRQDLNSKLDLILQHLQGKTQKESTHE